MAITETALGSTFTTAAAASAPAITCAAAVAVGQVIVVRCGGSGAVTFTVADSKGNTYTSVGSVSQATAPATITQAFVCKVTTALTTSDTITVSKSSSTGQIEADAILVSGVTNVQDGATVTGTPTTQAFTLTAMTLAAGSGLFVVGSGGAVLTSITPGTGFSADRAAVTSTGTSNRTTAFLSKTDGAAGSFTPGGTWQPSGQTYPASFVAFALVADTAPTVSITSPANASTQSGTITVAATASDDLAVASVTFKVDGATISTDTTSPYTASLDTTTLSNGTHSLTAVATDSNGQTTTSSAVSITVANGSVGRFPTTLCAELNRLANGGASYPAVFRGERAAANAWAGTSGYDIVGALNLKAGNPRGTGRWLDLDGVCNQLAGTSGLNACEALRRVLL